MALHGQASWCVTQLCRVLYNAVTWSIRLPQAQLQTVVWSDTELGRRQGRVLLHSSTRPGALFCMETALKVWHPVVYTSPAATNIQSIFRCTVAGSYVCFDVGADLEALMSPCKLFYHVQAWYWTRIAYNYEEEGAESSAAAADAADAAAIKVNMKFQGGPKYVLFG